MNSVEICKLLDVKEDEIKEFETEDPFNNNLLKGFLCNRADYRYGALVITSVNDEDCCQIIYGTPKMHYPFDKNGVFNWPKIDELEVWEKLDGTNVLAYHYTYKNQDFVTYKTRLTPVIRDTRFGYFEAMWRDILDTYKWVTEIINLNSDCNLSFELYGMRNPITISYDENLLTSVLFSVNRSDHTIRPPTKIKGCTIKMGPRFYLYSGKNIQDVYNDLRLEMSVKNKDGLFIEGVIFYAHVDGLWKQFKCKPEEIEKIHWSNGGIPKIALWTTAMNAYENNEEPTLDDFMVLLNEEYTSSQINRSILRIQKIFYEVHIHMKMVASVNKVWSLAKMQGLDITKDKNTTMKYISQYFDKKEMNKVGTIILKQSGLI